MKNSLRQLLVAIAFVPASALVAHAAATRPFSPLKLGQVRGLAFDQAGNLYVRDLGSATLYKITPAGAISVVPSAPIKHLHAPPRSTPQAISTWPTATTSRSA